MSSIEFFKATSGGKLNSIENSIDSLHNRRSLVIKDPIAQSIWLVHGSNAAESTQLSAAKSAKEMNAETGFQFEIKQIDYDDAEEKIQEILDQTSDDAEEEGTNEDTPEPPTSTPSQRGMRKTVSRSSVPRTPTVGNVGETEVKLKGDDEDKGPEIKEFQIAYYQDTTEDTTGLDEEIPTIETLHFKEILQLVSKYIGEVDTVMKQEISRDKASKILSEISEKIIDLSYN